MEPAELLQEFITNYNNIYIPVCQLLPLLYNVDKTFFETNKTFIYVLCVYLTSGMTNCLSPRDFLGL